MFVRDDAEGLDCIKVLAKDVLPGLWMVFSNGGNSFIARVGRVDRPDGKSLYQGGLYRANTRLEIFEVNIRSSSLNIVDIYPFDENGRIATGVGKFERSASLAPDCICTVFVDEFSPVIPQESP